MRFLFYEKEWNKHRIVNIFSCVLYNKRTSLSASSAEGTEKDYGTVKSEPSSLAYALSFIYCDLLQNRKGANTGPYWQIHRIHTYIHTDLH